MFLKAKKFLDSNIVEAKSTSEFRKGIEEKKMVLAYFCGEKDVEAKVKEEYGVTSRCMPFTEDLKEGRCIFSGKPAKRKALFAKAY